MTTLEQKGSHEVLFSGFTRPLKKTDLPFLKPILETWIRDRKTRMLLNDEVEETLRVMEESIEGRSDRIYYVAETEDGNIAGSIGMGRPDPRMLSFAQTDSPAEIVNAFVSDAYRRRGVGRALIEALETEARQRGYKELLLNSGPRYMHTGWAAWSKLFGKPVAIAQGYYDVGGDAPVWRKLLS